MSNKKTTQKYCNCHESSDEEILKPNVENSFCEKCGSIMLKSSNGTIFYLLKSKQNRVYYEFNPVNIIKRMKKKTEDKYPYIYNLYNIPEESENNKRERAMNSINIYLKYRKNLIQKLQKLMKLFDYHDAVFYQTLFFCDNFLSHDITLDMSEKTILYYLIGYFLCSLKSKETDAYEPAFDNFLDIEKGMYLSPNKIGLYEVMCIKRIKYNIFSYSAYDWLLHLLSNGIIFNTEVDSANEIIMIKGHRHSLLNAINKFAVKLLLNITPKEFFFKYCPMYMAFSLVLISREKYLKKNMIKPKLFLKIIELYGIHFDDFKNCYEEIKSEINKHLKDSKHEAENNDEKKNENGDPNKINTKRYSVDKIEKNFSKKVLYMPIKSRNSNAAISLKKYETYALSKDEKEKHNETKIKDKKVKFERNNHYLIDCSTSEFKSNDTLPLVFKNSNKEKKLLNPINLKQNQFHLSTENEEQIPDKFKSNDKISKINLNNIRIVKNKLLTSTKIPRINLEEFTSKNNNKEEEQKKELTINADNGRKRYKLKTNIKIESKAAIP